MSREGIGHGDVVEEKGCVTDEEGGCRGFEEEATAADGPAAVIKRVVRPPMEPS